jgi:hypothetical protein
MIPIPFAHAGHAVALLPFFAPPIVLTLGLLVLIVRDRLARRRAASDRDGQDLRLTT